MEAIIRIKQKAKSNQKIERLLRRMLRPYFWLNMKKEFFVVWLRKRILNRSSQYRFLRNLRNTHIGERCFIVATGPSLTIKDLDSLHDSDVYCFGMNSCVLVLDRTKWVPNLFGIQDEFVYKSVEDKLNGFSENLLKGRILVSNTIKAIFPSAKKYPKFYLHYLDHKYDRERTGKIKFSEECSNVVYDGYSVIFSLMQIAIYMGFNEIYLLGCDCNYKQEKQHFVETGHVDPYAMNVGERLIYIHSKFKEFADSHGVKVVNCTRGGMLEVYPRKTLEEVLSTVNS